MKKARFVLTERSAGMLALLLAFAVIPSMHGVHVASQLQEKVESIRGFGLRWLLTDLRQIEHSADTLVMRLLYPTVAEKACWHVTTGPPFREEVSCVDIKR